jgi:hypothetical protein
MKKDSLSLSLSFLTERNVLRAIQPGATGRWRLKWPFGTLKKKIKLAG